ncbi:hypothetical protein AAC387_Pa04g0198 [Persea americana]
MKNGIEILPPYVPAAYPQFPVFLPSERRKTGKSTLPPMRAAVNLQLPAFLLSERTKTGKSTLPPMRAAVKLQLPVFLPSERRKAGNCSFTADEGGGKGPTGSFPPLRVEEYLKMRAYRPCKQR